MVKLLSTFLLALLPFFFTESYNVIIDLLNVLIKAFGDTATSTVLLFPQNPCGSIVGSCSDFVSGSTNIEPSIMTQVVAAIAWLLPINFLVDVVGYAMIAVTGYFTVAPVARWFKLIT